MKGFNFLKRFRIGEDPVEETVIRIQGGDNQLREKLIHDYRPFVIKTVSHVTGKFIEIENCEEYSIGLMAFNEAINCFQAGKHKSFIGFSELVVNRRVIDYIRKNKKNDRVLPFTYFEKDERNQLEDNHLMADPSSMVENVEIKEEILMFKEKLESFGIKLSDLALCVPKHRDSKQLCVRIAGIIAGNKDLFDKLARTKNIPMTDLLKVIDVYHGTVERNRKFIIAVALIMNSGMDVLKSYVQIFEKGGAVRV